jgi:cytochrome c
MKNIYLILFAFSFLLTISCRQKRSGNPRVLVYTNHTPSADVTAAIQALQKLGDINGFEINPTDTTNLFTDDSLSAYAAVLFLNRSGVNFGNNERIALERFIQAGGGFAGIHPTAETYNWRWYGRMIGSTGDSGVSFMHQEYDGGRAEYNNDSLTAKNAGEDAHLNTRSVITDRSIIHWQRRLIPLQKIILPNMHW